jgi:hypothetical protein
MSARFWDKVQITEGCWLWQSWIGTHGYGHYWLDHHVRQAHRVAYELAVGPIPEGLQIDHLCRVRHCVRPDHLEAVTRLENVRRGKSGEWQRSKTHCPQGHEFTPENTRLTREGWRQCKPCLREADRRYRERKALA